MGKRREEHPENHIRTKKKAESKKCRDGSFNMSDKCCRKKCYELVPGDVQEELYALYTRFNTKESQDMYLSGCMRWAEPNRKKTNPKKERSRVWTYTVSYNKEIEIQLCKALFMQIFNASSKRLRVLQEKIVKDDTFDERRGKYERKEKTITEELRALMNAHLLSIPHRKSHYTTSQMKYFTNSSLTVRRLYNLFKVYYFKKKAEKLKLSENSYYKLFQRCKFAIQKPHSDRCNLGEQYKFRPQRRPRDPCRVALMIHQRRVRKYVALKREIVRNPPADTLVIEFDYAQNQAILKLNINEQFYKRLMWLYNFNVHCHNDKDSSFYTFYEYEGAKGSNSVASFVYHFVLRKFAENSGHFKKLIVFSDGAGGQNKNWTMTRFFAWLSRSENLEIEHFYPVRGHSFCVCDRNFGYYGKTLKKMENITSFRTYLQVFSTCRAKPQPFNITYDRSLLTEYSEMFDLSPTLFVPKSTSFKIRGYSRMKYIRGMVQVARSYCPFYTPFQVIRCNATQVDLQLPRIPSPEKGMKQKKADDVRDLLKYVRNRNDWLLLRGIVNKYGSKQTKPSTTKPEGPVSPPAAVKRRGRPPKASQPKKPRVEDQREQQVAQPKRGRGRPRKNALPALPAPA